MENNGSNIRPGCVPALNLDVLGGDVPGSNNLQHPLKTEEKLKSPDSKSPYSWGTPLSLSYHTLKQGSRGTAPQGEYQQQSKSKDHPTSFTNKHKEHQLVQANDGRHKKVEIKSPAGGDAVSRNKGNSKPAYWYDEFRDRTPSPKPDNSPTIDDIAQLQAKYTVQSYSDVQSARKYAAEDGLVAKQKQQVMDQVLADQLSRHVISDPDQDRDPARSNPADPFQYPPGVPVAPLRMKSRRLHDTKISTAGAVTETNLRSRITFSARILTRNGRDALRELFGFFFNHDRTVTVYEYRIFGKNNCKALPFITRRKYKHQVGRRKEKEYCSEDIELKKNLSFTTPDQQHLPDTLKKQKILTIRISEVHDSCSSSNDGWQLSTDARDTDARLEKKDREILKNVQEFVRQKLSTRSVTVMMGLGQLFRNIDKSGDGLLNKSELSQALEAFGVTIPSDKFEAVWRVVDENNDGAIDYGEFVRSFIGEMNEFRKHLVQKVFKKLDPHKTGSASLMDLKKLYSAKKHPLVTSGQVSQDELELRFVDSFSGSESGRVGYVEFEEYYEGLSIVITNDNDFSNMMKNCWGV